MTMAIPMIDVAKERLRGVGIISAQREQKKIALPLADVKISAKVVERIASVTIVQTFQNPYPEHLEAVYIFPLPGGAAVSDFEMKVGARIVRGKVQERGQARRDYQQAINEGKRAALMEKERDDVFTVQVGNIVPGEEISIKITYSERLMFFDDGTTELRLPLVVAPRYTPGQAVSRDSVGDGVELDTNLVPDASRISPPRLAKGFDPKIGLGIDVTILWGESEEGEDIKDLCCSQHASRTSAGREGIKVSLARNDELMDRDFVLRWATSTNKLRTSLLGYKDEKGDIYGMLSLIPPKAESLNQARDVVFILDRSGSMQGIKMASAARACALLLATLGPRDRFAIQSYSNDVQWFQPPAFTYGVEGYFMPADYYGLELGEKYLREVAAGGGTETYNALCQTINILERRQEKRDRVPVIVLLTDGEVSDESRIVKEAQTRLNGARLFTVGIDTAVNEGFLKKLADVGRGTATFVTPGSQLETALVNVGREIGSPLVVDIKIYDIDSDAQLSTVAPRNIADLFTGRATSTFFMMKKFGKVRVRGRLVTGGEFEAIVDTKEIFLSAIAQLWAKTRITDLEDNYRIDPTGQERIKGEIIDLSVKYKILTRFTAFIAVDQEIANEEGINRKVVQPVETPADWDMDAMKVNLTQAGGYNANLTQAGFAGGARPSMPMPMKAQAPMSPMPAAPPSVVKSEMSVGRASRSAPSMDMKTVSVGRSAPEPSQQIAPQELYAKSRPNWLLILLVGVVLIGLIMLLRFLFR